MNKILKYILSSVSKEDMKQYFIAIEYDKYAKGLCIGTRLNWFGSDTVTMKYSSQNLKDNDIYAAKKIFKLTDGWKVYRLKKGIKTLFREKLYGDDITMNESDIPDWTKKLNIYLKFQSSKSRLDKKDYLEEIIKIFKNTYDTFKI